MESKRGGDTAFSASESEGGSYSHSFAKTPHLCGIFIFRYQSGTFFELKATRGQMRPQKRPQDDFLNINTCDMSFLEFRVMVAAQSCHGGRQNCLKISILKYSHVIRLFIGFWGPLTHF